MIDKWISFDCVVVWLYSLGCVVAAEDVDAPSGTGTAVAGGWNWWCSWD